MTYVFSIVGATCLRL